MRDRPYKVGKGKRKYPETIFRGRACLLRTSQPRIVLLGVKVLQLKGKPDRETWGGNRFGVRLDRLARKKSERVKDLDGLDHLIVVVGRALVPNVSD